MPVQPQTVRPHMRQLQPKSEYLIGGDTESEGRRSVGLRPTSRCNEKDLIDFGANGDAQSRSRPLTTPMLDIDISFFDVESTPDTMNRSPRPATNETWGTGSESRSHGQLVEAGASASQDGLGLGLNLIELSPENDTKGKMMSKGNMVKKSKSVNPNLLVDLGDDSRTVVSGPTTRRLRETITLYPGGGVGRMTEGGDEDLLGDPNGHELGGLDGLSVGGVERRIGDGMDTRQGKGKGAIRPPPGLGFGGLSLMD